MNDSLSRLTRSFSERLRAASAARVLALTCLARSWAADFIALSAAFAAVETILPNNDLAMGA